MNLSNKNIYCIGINHKDSNISLREKLYLQADEISQIILKSLYINKLDELIILSTCNRTEIVAVASSDIFLDSSPKEIFFNVQKLNPRSTDISREDMLSICFLYQGNAAIEHLLRVTSGLDSLVIGETQITGQFKSAVELAKSAGTLGPILHRLYQEALATSKKVRSYTKIGSKPVSISHVAIELAERISGKLEGKVLLILGSGQMAKTAAKFALDYDPKDILILNRTLEKAGNLCLELGAGRAFPLSQIQEILPQADIIIASTKSDQYLITKEILPTRVEKSQYFIDISLPRNIDPEISELEDIYLFDIDDLKQIVNENKKHRKKASHQASDIISSRMTCFCKWMASYDIKPALAEFRTYLDKLTSKEIKKSLEKEMMLNLDDTQLNAIHKLLKSVTDKIVIDAAKNIHKPPQGVYKEQLATSLSILFPNTKDQNTEFK